MAKTTPASYDPFGVPLSKSSAKANISRRRLIKKLSSSRWTQRESAAEILLRCGDVAPNFQLQAADGTTMQLSDFRGKKVMVCFYCHPSCKIRARTVNNLIGHYKKVS